MPADQEPSEGFTFRDRRSAAAAADAPPAAAPEPAPAAAAAAAAVESVDNDALRNDPATLRAGAQGMDEMEAGMDGAADANELPDVYAVLALFLGELRNFAWLRMGLVANPGTGQIERDLPQAKVAIDTVAFLAEQLEPTVAPQERLPLRALVSDLQINFVEQSKRA